MSIVGPRVPIARPPDALGATSDLDLQTAARERFLAAVDEYRAEIHRYCTRMTGSALDGEDVVQEALATAYFRLPLYLEARGSMRSWLFRIAHNKCIDLLRRSGSRRADPIELAEDEAVGSATPWDSVRSREEVRTALSRLVHALAPRERACLILKDVLGYSLSEIADLTDTSVGAVKSALHRARSKLDRAGSVAPDEAEGEGVEAGDEASRLLDTYVDRFNARDWDGLERLLSADARLEVVGVFSGEGQAAIRRLYFGNYSQMPLPVYLTRGRVDGEDVLVGWQKRGSSWVPVTAVRHRVEAGAIVAIRDYLHSEYVMTAADIDGPLPSVER